MVERRFGWVTALGALAVACGGSTEDASEDPAVARGRTVYKNICITCHNADPTQPGVLGPAVAGSSRELLVARVLRGEYPPGYTPKMQTAGMPQFPYLEEQIPDLEAYLASVVEEGDPGSGSGG